MKLRRSSYMRACSGSCGRNTPALLRAKSTVALPSTTPVVSRAALSGSKQVGFLSRVGLNRSCPAPSRGAFALTGLQKADRAGPSGPRKRRTAELASPEPCYHSRYHPPQLVAANRTQDTPRPTLLCRFELHARGDTNQLTSIEDFVNGLLDPAGRERRHRAVQSQKRSLISSMSLPRLSVHHRRPSRRVDQWASMDLTGLRFFVARHEAVKMSLHSSDVVASQDTLS